MALSVKLKITSLMTCISSACMLFLGGCTSGTASLANDTEVKTKPEMTISALSFIGEKVIPQTLFQGTTVGGLSGIDYHDGIYYLVSDDNGNETDAFQGQPRAYTATIEFDNTGIDSVVITDIISLKDKVSASGSVPFAPGNVDPEAMRLDPKSGNLIWVNEGQIKNGLPPGIREVSPNGDLIRTFPLPDMFKLDPSGEKGPRHNVVFEGLSFSFEGQGFWVSMEGPIIQDGEEAGFEDSLSPIRISLFSRNSGALVKQFAYELDSVVYREGADSKFHVNGVVDILEYADHQFLVLERSYVAGQADGGNDVKLYKVDASNASDVFKNSALKGASYKVAKKSLLLDFNDIRHLLTKVDGVHTVDNLEGITFGPVLPNGNPSLVVVGDNNFSAFAEQLNQFLVFEVLP